MANTINAPITVTPNEVDAPISLGGLPGPRGPAGPIGIIPTIQKVTDYAVIEDVGILLIEVITGDTDITITLPALGSGRIIYITKIDSGTGNVIVTGALPINGEDSLIIQNQYTTAQIQAGTEEWRII